MHVAAHVTFCVTLQLQNGIAAIMKRTDKPLENPSYITIKAELVAECQLQLLRNNAIRMQLSATCVHVVWLPYLALHQCHSIWVTLAY